MIVSQKQIASLTQTLAALPPLTKCRGILVFLLLERGISGVQTSVAAKKAGSNPGFWTKANWRTAPTSAEAEIVPPWIQTPAVS